MHDIHEKSVDGFLKALPDLIGEGYEFVTVSELYQLKKRPLEAGKVYYGPNLKNKYETDLKSLMTSGRFLLLFVKQLFMIRFFMNNPITPINLL